MSERGRRLADELAALTAEVAEVVAGCSEEQWRRPCRNEGRTIGVVAFHIADGYRYALAILDAAISDGPYPDWVGRTVEQGATINARQAAEHAGITREEVLALLHANATAADVFLRNLSDEQLDREPSFAPGRTTADLVERILLGHPRAHLPNVIASLSD